MSKSAASPFAKRVRALLALATGLSPVGAANAEEAKPPCILTHNVTPNAVVDGEVYRVNSETDFHALYRVQLIPTSATGGQDAQTGTLAVWYQWTPSTTRQYQMAVHNPFYKEGETVTDNREVFLTINGAGHTALFASPTLEWLEVKDWQGGDALPTVTADPTVMFRNTSKNEPNVTFTYPAGDAKQAFEIAPQVFNALVDYANKGECTVRQQIGADPDSIFDSIYDDATDWGCFLTTATCKTVGLEDDCWELTTLRQFRDGWLAWQEGGAEDIARYYREAPAIARALGSDQQAALRLYWTRIVPSALAAHFGANRLARRIYTRMMGELGVA
ncbi:hypothetical protein SZ64_02925 [Erythrobacter sp. SG61-1L]|uniref:CFI-box-CTERM domain-containing protein n=1 Tax=Erythrobacter sp. SG61-1L TaxID=1603897 RepID=UPI0006C90559|nr:CFI-box-CTERM domain-containing protein [Erythrobacter sp. SG61-1L]KPL67140.1 hypothetical protein SZ64_02925 [Erythrobacter sp. SG61-1L]